MENLERSKCDLIALTNKIQECRTTDGAVPNSTSEDMKNVQSKLHKQLTFKRDGKSGYITDDNV